MIHLPDKLETAAIASLRNHDRNARTHSKAQIEQIRRSIDRFGFTNPVLIDGAGTIIAGHGRVATAKLLKLENVPVLRLEHLTEAERRAYIIADNRLAELAGWDKELLQLELGAILAVEADFDLALTGFDNGELEALLSASDTPTDGADDVPVVDRDEAAVSALGNMWLLGNHRLLCGDARTANAYATLLGNDRAQMVITDPPYNVPVNGHVCGLGKVKHREFAMASGKMTEAQFVNFLTAVCAQVAAFSVDGSIHYICMDWRALPNLRGIAVVGRLGLDLQLRSAMLAELSILRLRSVVRRLQCRLSADGQPNGEGTWRKHALPRCFDSTDWTVP